MKRASLTLALFASLFTIAHAQDAPIEDGAMISDGNGVNMRNLISPAVGMIRAMGWRCDSISAMRPYLMSRGFTVVCNNFNYTYNISDKGGNWVVELDE